MAAGSVLCRSAKVLSLTCLLVCLLVLLIETSVKSEKYDIYVSKQLRMNDEHHLFNRVSIRPANNFGFKSRAKRYLAGRVQYTAKGTSTFNLERDLLMCGDISENPGPGKTKSATKYPCGECRKAVKNNQDAILCACCHKWSHAKCLQISPTIFAQFSIPGYSLYRKNRKKGGGGIMALISSSLVNKRIKIDRTLKTLEMIALEIKTGTNNMVIIGIYRPPKALCGDYQTSLESELSYVCNWASLKNNSVVVLGDLNLDRLRPDKREGKLLLDLETEQGLTCLITQPTRTEKRGTMITSTLIDVLLTNRPELFKRSGNYYPALSDHAMIFGILRDRVKPTKPKVISFRSYRNFNLEDFNKDLSMVPWQVGEIFDEADDQLFFWDTMAREIIDKHVPVKTMRVRNHDAPYMNKQWKSAIRTKRKAEAKYRKNRTDENWEYKRKCRNEATRQRRLAIKQYWKTKADDLGKNPKDFFRTFKPFISDKGNRADADITINHGEAIVKDQSKVSEIFADYFATIADHIKSVDADLTDLKDFTNHPSVQAIKNKMEDTSETFEFQPVNRMQVKTALESLDTNKATGHDGIPAKILKAGAQELSLPLTTLFNSCIRKAQWPSDWKKGDWIPVFKKEDKQAKENYRPVTVLTCASKVLERLLSNQFTSSFDRRLGDCLTAYRKHNSCETTIVSLVEDWKQARDKHLSVAILSTDMSKAFDCLHPPLLLSKFKKNHSTCCAVTCAIARGGYALETCQAHGEM